MCVCLPADITCITIIMGLSGALGKFSLLQVNLDRCTKAT